MKKNKQEDTQSGRGQGAPYIGFRRTQGLCLKADTVRRQRETL